MATLLLLLLLGAAPAAQAAPRLATTGLSLHVGGPRCHADGPGTPDRPFCAPAAALRAAPAGATALLRGGTYAAIRLEGVANQRPVTLAPARGARAVVEGIELTEVRGLRIRDLVLTDGIDADRTEDLQVLRTEIALRHAGLATRSAIILGQSRNVLIRDNYVHDGRDGVILRGHLPRNSDVTIAGNTFRRLGNDGVFVGRSSERVLVVGNRFEDVRPHDAVDPAAHSDGVQVSGPTQDVVLWGNRFTGGRGIIVAIFDRTPTANRGLVIARNVTLGPMFGIRLFSAPGARIVNNTVWGTSSNPEAGVAVYDRLFPTNEGSAGMVVANNVARHMLVDPAAKLAARSANLVGGDPAFADLAAGDVRLTDASAAVDAAAPAWAPQYDAEGSARVGRPDAGAYERGGRAVGLTRIVRRVAAVALGR